MTDDPVSVLLAIERSGRVVPRVRLPDAPEEPEPDARWSSRVDLLMTGRYEVLGEIARGGVGVILKGRDPDLGRDVAVKILRKEHRDAPEVVQRFVDEAQISGQLQHPGIVPVYELGLLPDDRPFFAMKLVRGRTLAAALRARRDPRKELRRFLTIFEQVCQTMAYAHSRGVVHRDLKPSNVMIGAYGEVQIVDWGFAKVLPQGGAADDRRARRRRKGDADVTVVETVRTASEGSDSIEGSILGTPPYMSPEQALGRTDLDERSDVFSLGAILCEILTGEPPYRSSKGDPLSQATQGELRDAYDRLDACGLDETIVAIAKDCLAPRRRDRPLDARTLVARLSAHLASVSQRAHEAKLRAIQARRKASAARAEADRARSEARAQRQRRRQAVAIWILSVLLIALGVGGYTWVNHDRRQRVRRTESAIDEAVAEAKLHEGSGDWEAALAAAERALEIAVANRVDPGTESSVRALRNRLSREMVQATADREILARVRNLRPHTGRYVDVHSIDDRFREAFLDYGVDVRDPDPESVGLRLRERRIAVDLAGALTSWAYLRSRHRLLRDRDWRSLFVIAQTADPDPRRSRIRRELLNGDRVALREVVAELDVSKLPAVSIATLGRALSGLGQHHEAIRVLDEGVTLHPGSFWIRYHLGNAWSGAKDHWAALRAFRGALALRPGDAWTHVHIGDAYLMNQRSDEALPYYERARELDPKVSRAHIGIGLVHYDHEDWKRAAESFREGSRHAPNDANLHNLTAVCLEKLGDLDEAEKEYLKAIELDEELPYVHVALAQLYARTDRGEEARHHLDIAFEQGSDKFRTVYDIARAYHTIGDLEGAINHYRIATRLDPDHAQTHYTLSALLWQTGRLEEAIPFLRKAYDLGAVPEERVKWAERLVALLPTLEAVLQRGEEPDDVKQCLDLVELCKWKSLHRRAALLSEWAFEKGGAEAVRLAGGRFAAARHAVLASERRGKDAEGVDAEECARLRGMALEWLEADLARLGASGADGAKKVARWLADADLEAVRDPLRLAGLPPRERTRWESLWAEARAFCRRASAD